MVAGSRRSWGTAITEKSRYEENGRAAAAVWPAQVVQDAINNS